MDFGWILDGNGWILINVRRIFGWLLIEFGWILIDIEWLLMDFDCFLMDLGCVLMDFRWMFDVFFCVLGSDSAVFVGKSTY